MVLRSTLNQATRDLDVHGHDERRPGLGPATARLTLDGDTANYKGTATITSGTGRYRRASASNIAFTGVGPVSAKQHADQPPRPRSVLTARDPSAHTDPVATGRRRVPRRISDRSG